MPPSAPVIRRGSPVRLHMAIHLPDGTEALSTFGEEPLDLTLGDGTLTAATEDLLLGLEGGAREQIIADGSDLFGPWTEDKLHWLASDAFPNGVPEVGTLAAFDTPGGAETAGLIREVEGSRILVDFNHPLSGRALRIQVEILEVRDLPAPGDSP
jgi:FKBP-type peptidyl-prolyl cis-trans isomerase SlpA